ncbi:MAG: beta strand repeat-containing protein, partial [Allorhizobium sp.]
MPNGATFTFANVQAGTARINYISVENTGGNVLASNGSLSFANVTNVSNLAFTSATSFSLIQGATSTHDFTYTPTSPGPFSFDVIIPSNDPDQASSYIRLQGTAIDAVGPQVQSITRYSPTTSTTTVDSLIWEVTFSEAVTGVGPEDFTVTGVTGGTVSVDAVSGSVYRVTVLGGDLAGLEGTVTLAQATTPSITDTSGNALVRNATTSSYFVFNPPSVVLSPITVSAGVYTTTATFSEPVTGFTASDLVVVNGTATLTGSGAVYTITLTPGSTGSLSVIVPQNKATDAAGNSNTQSNAVSITPDRTAPTVSISALSGPTGGKFTATITLSETSIDFVAGDLTLVNATATMTGSGTTYTVTLTPSADGTVSVTVPAGAFTDNAGNANTASNTASATYVTAPPTATISALTGPTSGKYTATITLSDASTDFVVGDLTLVNATATMSGSGTTYTVTLTPAADGTVSVTVPVGVFTNGSGIANTASNTVSATYDSTPPTVSIGTLTGPTGGEYTATITLSEASTDFEVGDLTLVNATAAMSGSGTTYTVTLTPSADGTLSVTVPAGAFTDAAGNANTASNTASAIYDATSPTVSIGTLSGPTGGEYTATITLSEASTDFVVGDLTLVNATATMSGSGTTYTVTLTPVADGTLSVTVPAGAFTDAAGNANTASNTASAIYDATSPTVTVSALSGPTSGEYTATITLSEASTDFVVGDLTLVNATATMSGSGTTYTVTLTPSADGTLSVT